MVTARKRSSAGFTLVELMVAVALLAVLSVVSFRGLDSILKARDRLTQIGDELKAATVAFGQLDEDLRRSWPMRAVIDRQREVTVGFLSGQGTSPELFLLREGGGALDPVRAEQVSYRLKDGKLERGFRPYVVGRINSAGEYTWQSLMDNVSDLKIKMWIKGAGWVDSAEKLNASRVNAVPPGNPSGNPSGNASSNAPTTTAYEVLGVDVEITLKDQQVLRRIYSVRD